MYAWLFCTLLFLHTGCEDTDSDDGAGADDGPPPEPRAILVLAPHPDDTVLGCGAIIMQALADGDRVAVVVLTDGDAYAAAAHLLGKSTKNLTADDYLYLAGVRQSEEIAATTALGLPPADLYFLGYPDAGMQQVYATQGDDRYWHAYTHKTETYGIRQTDYHTAAHGAPAPYRRSAVVEDLAEIILALAPGEVYVTNENDTHPDHEAAFRFVRDAVAATEFHGLLLTYLVHADPWVTWPDPPCATPDQPFTPQVLMEGGYLSTGVPWPPPVRIALTPAEAARKSDALQCYYSQTEVREEGDYLFSFVKSEKVFWPVDR